VCVYAYSLSYTAWLVHVRSEPLLARVSEMYSSSTDTVDDEDCGLIYAPFCVHFFFNNLRFETHSAACLSCGVRVDL
jgi:hypothetical protein